MFLLTLSIFVPGLLAAQSGSGTGGTPGMKRQELHYRGYPGKPLTVITPNDPGFDTEMALDFPNYTVLANYQASRPFLVILRNDTQRTARAYEVIWHVQVPDSDAPGGVGEERFSASAITTPLETRWPGGIRKLDRSIPPGGARVISPVFNGGRADAEDFSFLNNPAELPAPASYSSVSVELDCVVYGDASFAGPNRSHLLLRYLVARDAQHDEALSVLRSLRSSPENPQLKTALDLRVKIGASHTRPNNRAKPIYIHARSVAAQEFDEMLQKGGYTRVQRVAEALVAHMPPHQRFTELGGLYHRMKFRVNGALVSPMD